MSRSGIEKQNSYDSIQVPSPMRSPDLNYYFVPVFFLAFGKYSPIYDSNHHIYFPVTYLIVGEKSHLITDDFFLFPVTYFIAACFFSVYAMAVDTLFLCFLVDSENNDGTAEKPYYMSEGLMKILSVKNKAKYAK